MSGEFDKYQFPETVNETRRIVGVAWDECIIISLPILIGIMFKCSLVMIVVAVLSWLLVRKLKAGKGTQYMVDAIYWHLPFIHHFFKKIPASGLRHWIN